MIKVKMFGVFDPYMPSKNGAGEWEIDQTGCAIRDILGQTPVLTSPIKYTVMVNGERRTPDDIVSDGDTLIVMPLLSGG
jgi:molybdopterin converting factor small subunit